MNSRLTTFLAAGLAVIAPAARAHVSISSGNAIAGASQEITFSVGHGCNDGAKALDTYSVKVDIPAGFTSARPLAGDFGPFTVTKDASGAVRSVTWTKSLDDVRADDDAYYKLVIRLRVPDAPFTTAYFAVHQTCRTSSGGEIVVDWVGTPSAPADEPAAELNIVAPHRPGWNKYTSTQAIADLSVYFEDAIIVWRGKAAYSRNESTTAQIAATQGVTALARIEPGEEFWVKY